ncbi:MAG: hypothetical protein HOV81_25060 [Kofleriaceae bacterium]|nr:hypothetical protein [Kofleriaceae bacterium]
MVSADELVRFVVPAVIDADSQKPVGLINFAHELADADATSEDTRRELDALLAWFDKALPVPDRFNRTKSKGWYRRQTRGISWLRANATEHIAAMRQLVDVVTRCGHEVTEIRAHRVGYVTYEDEAQVVAEPFRDTPTK